MDLVLRAFDDNVRQGLNESHDRLLLDQAHCLIDRDRAIPLSQLAGFLALQTSRASEISQALLKKGVWTDCRGSVLRLGPAPYLSDDQLIKGMKALGEVVVQLSP